MLLTNINMWGKQKLHRIKNDFDLLIEKEKTVSKYIAINDFLDRDMFVFTNKLMKNKIYMNQIHYTKNELAKEISVLPLEELEKLKSIIDYEFDLIKEIKNNIEILIRMFRNNIEFFTKFRELFKKHFPNFETCNYIRDPDYCFYAFVYRLEEFKQGYILCNLWNTFRLMKSEDHECYNLITKILDNYDKSSKIEI